MRTLALAVLGFLLIAPIAIAGGSGCKAPPPSCKSYHDGFGRDSHGRCDPTCRDG
jgi:hypothetical protein